MTTTKLVYLLAAILPFGFALLAAALLVRTVMARRKAQLSAATPN